MKKTILTIAILTASAFANAEYMIQIPLEANGGGALPNGSIQIVKNGVNPTNPAPEPVEPEAPALTPEQACFARESEARSLVAAHAVNATFTTLRLRPNTNNGPQCEIQISAPKALYSSFCGQENLTRSIALGNILVSNNFTLYTAMYGDCL
ncbi:hypothetical protein MP293_003506 [Escherichia coli]|nr:hypothetical protein [Escherichia coli]